MNNEADDKYNVPTLEELGKFTFTFAISFCYSEFSFFNLVFLPLPSSIQ